MHMDRPGCAPASPQSSHNRVHGGLVRAFIEVPEPNAAQRDVPFPLLISKPISLQLNACQQPALQSHHQLLGAQGLSPKYDAFLQRVAEAGSLWRPQVAPKPMKRPWL